MVEEGITKDRELELLVKIDQLQEQIFVMTTDRSHYKILEESFYKALVNQAETIESLRKTVQELVKALIAVCDRGEIEHDWNCKKSNGMTDDMACNCTRKKVGLQIADALSSASKHNITLNYGQVYKTRDDQSMDRD